MSIPLLCGDALVGALTLYAGERQAFTDDQGRLVQMIAPHLAQAIARTMRAGSTAELSAAVDETPAQGPRGLRLIASR